MAGHLGAQLGQEARCREIFAEAARRYPTSDRVPRVLGWSLVNLQKPAEALTTFQASDTLRPKDSKPNITCLAGLAISQWLLGIDTPSCATPP